MTTIELARTLASHGEIEAAQKAYTLSLEQADGTDPAAEMEAAAFLMDCGGDYRITYTTFQSLYNRGHFQEQLFDLMVGAFYAPNLKPQEKMYQRNCRLLSKYPYLFRKDFPPLEDLPVKLFPYDDNGYLPFDVRENRFDDYVNPNHPVVSRNFFANLDNPILAQDVYSQYELEYLNDNVRKSEWVARENHIYLHYTDWTTFCSYLQCLDFRELVKEQKLVFLIEEEASLYPIDFQARFGIDYSQYTVKPIGIREVNKLIWHTQLSSHNGGDFFNEIFYGHPNLIVTNSMMFGDTQEKIKKLYALIQSARQAGDELCVHDGFDKRIMRTLLQIRDVTEKDLLVAIFLADNDKNTSVDPAARIAPALFFQPHFYDIKYTIKATQDGWALLDSEEYDAIRRAPIFQRFRYIKTFTPMRRMTTSYAATVKFMLEHRSGEIDNRERALTNAIEARILNRSFMVDWQDRLYQDSILVRFEDGKLNPRATFSALAAFLDLPYTESMTYCSGISGINPESLSGNVLGFDTATVYRVYENYANHEERYFIEYLMRDAYAYYGYDLQYYDGEPVSDEKMQNLISRFDTLHAATQESFIRAHKAFLKEVSTNNVTEAVEFALDEESQALITKQAVTTVQAYDAATLHAAQLLMRNLSFVNRSGQPLRMMPKLELDPALLEQPLYH